MEFILLCVVVSVPKNIEVNKSSNKIRTLNMEVNVPEKLGYG